MSSSDGVLNKLWAKGVKCGLLTLPSGLRLNWKCAWQESNLLPHAPQACAGYSTAQKASCEFGSSAFAHPSALLERMLPLLLSLTA